MEHIVSFVPGQLPDERRLAIQMTGITFPDRTYHIVREHADLYCIEYVIAGCGEVMCAGRRFNPGPGDVYLLPPGVRHEYRAAAADPYKKIWMNVSGTLCDALYREYGLEGTMLFRRAPVRPLFQRFLEVCETGKDNPRALSVRAALLIHEIFAALAALCTVAPQVPDPYAARIREYLDRHVEDNIRLGQAAHELGLSVSQLTRSFARAYAMPPYRYYLGQRIELAQSLLSNTGMRVRDVAARLHCADEHYFSAQFKQYAGVSPRAYRNGRQEI
ncbi:MAG: AraC family transcriptional regulator [Bifidobacterium sp.]|jgi:AraC-like DNA-binding protein|nr:AraC family transcriptional regulator [Bifidobacterium sp.]